MNPMNAARLWYNFNELACERFSDEETLGCARSLTIQDLEMKTGEDKNYSNFNLSASLANGLVNQAKSKPPDRGYFH